MASITNRRGIWSLALGACAVLVGTRLPVRAASLDASGDLRLGLRTYALARVGSQAFDFTDNAEVLEGSFPASSAGHVRQLRYFTELALDHDLDRLVHDGIGPFALTNPLPFRLSGLKYNLVFRSEYDGVYDFGPREFSTAEAFRAATNPLTGVPLPPEAVSAQRQHLRNIAVHRERLFQAFVEANAGDLFIRFGRQILVWGETDVFRLLDNINPTDSSFGGFLIPLDERRVPLDMLRLNYSIGRVGPLSDLYVEGYGAVDKDVAYYPGIPAGSPWAPPVLGYPNTLIYPVFTRPAATLTAARGGVQVKANVALPAVGSMTVGLAHYYTRFDLPGIENQVHKNFLFIPFPNTMGAIVQSVLTAPMVQVSGLTSTFVIPSRYVRSIGLTGEPVIRSELAYFHNEPRYSQAQLDPFVFIRTPECRAAAEDALCTGGRRVGNSWNYVLGIDHNQTIRWLNPNQSILFSTQFFYKHLLNAVKRQPIRSQTGVVENGEVIPVPEEVDKTQLQLPFVRTPIDQYVQTLLVTTSYYSGQVTPAMILVYDWSGGFAALPQVTLSRDPFRFTMGYDLISAAHLKGASGVSLLHDRDNVFFQVEYAL
ncbi:MAG TPA: DUF1302 family protein [Candidatus Margulisiibacteriota bacterium]|nr:DUF1302 family protein [Candidatus Margulisiibacteriota bacterium]